MKPAKPSPVKDRRTVPWVSEDEIPAVKLLLRAWRKLRRDAPECARINAVFAESVEDPGALLADRLRDLAQDISLVAALEARLAKENTAE